jgi:ElaB/YqjD/DUF883 family membrane-anchored ribosome-binding protein
MDKGAERIAQDMKDIVETRVAIAEKLEAIEQHVGATMQHARTVMTQVADKTTSTVDETVKATKEVFDLRVQAARHPWMFVGGALALGYGVGMLYQRGWRISTGVVPYYPRGADSAPIMQESDAPREQRESGVYPFYPPYHETEKEGQQGRETEQTIIGELGNAFQEELGTVRDSFIRFGRGFIREMIRQTVPAIVRIIAGDRRNQRRPSDPPASI